MSPDPAVPDRRTKFVVGTGATIGGLGVARPRDRVEAGIGRAKRCGAISPWIRAWNAGTTPIRSRDGRARSPGRRCPPFPFGAAPPRPAAAPRSTSPFRLTRSPPANRERHRPVSPAERDGMESPRPRRDVEHHERHDGRGDRREPQPPVAEGTEFEDGEAHGAATCAKKKPNRISVTKVMVWAFGTPSDCQ